MRFMHYRLSKLPPQTVATDKNIDFTQNPGERVFAQPCLYRYRGFYQCLESYNRRQTTLEWLSL